MIKQRENENLQNCDIKAVQIITAIYIYQSWYSEISNNGSSS